MLFPSAQILEEAPVVYLLITSVNSYLFDFDFDHQLIRPKPRSGNCKRLKRVGFTKLHARLLCLLQPKTKKTQNHMNRSRSHRSGVIYGNVIQRKFQKSPGTYPRHPKVQMRKDSLQKQVVKGPGYVSGICWIFLEMIKHDETC